MSHCYSFIFYLSLLASTGSQRLSQIIIVFPSSPFFVALRNYELLLIEKSLQYYIEAQSMAFNLLSHRMEHSQNTLFPYSFHSPPKLALDHLNKQALRSKQIIKSPPHKSLISPLKVFAINTHQGTLNINLFKSVGTKSCSRIGPPIIASPEDKYQIGSKLRKFNIRTPNFLLSSENSKNKAENLGKFVYQNKIKARNIQKCKSEFKNDDGLEEIPKINFSKSSLSSHTRSQQYIFSRKDKSSSSNISTRKSVSTKQLTVPSFPRPKAQSLERQLAGTAHKVPTFIRFKQQQNQEMQQNSSIHFQQQKRQAGGFQIKINIKAAVKKRSFADFKVIRELGIGSFGKACLAIEKNLGFACVIKVIEKNMVNEYEIKSLMRQIKVQSFLNHLHTTSLYGFFDDEERVYLILQLLPTGNLKSQTKNRAVPEARVSNIIFQVLCAAEYMHKNRIIHRDIKPENIFTFDNYMRLGDFGCAVYCEEMRRSFVGSPCYLSPEQLRNEGYDEKVDIWEIGILTFELLYKASPFEKDILAIMQGGKAPLLSQLIFPSRGGISEEAKDFIGRTLRKEPSQRMQIRQALTHPFLRKQLQEYEQLTLTQI